MVTLESPFPKSTYKRNASIYRLLANPNRLEILNLLKIQELNVTQLVKLVKIRKSNISQHLSILRKLKLVKVRRTGKNAFYKIIDPRLVEPCRILNDLWSNSKY